MGIFDYAVLGFSVVALVVVVFLMVQVAIETVIWTVDDVRYYRNRYAIYRRRRQSSSINPN
jgi:hypothetical protein